MPLARSQPIKLVAYRNGVTQVQFATATGLRHMRVHKVFNGLEQPSLEFVEKAVAYFGRPEDELFLPFSAPEPIRIANKIAGRNRYKTGALTAAAPR
jgi:transcriptional regulator with XRE-family HTH domain